MGKQHKKSLFGTVLLALAFLFALPAASYAQTAEPSQATQTASVAQASQAQTASAAQTAGAAYSNADFSAMSYMLIETGTGQVLAQNDPDRKVYPASTTKIMTALLLMEKKGLDGTVTVGKEIDGLPTGSSLMHIIVGEKVTVKDLFYGLMLCSGNDAACTIATYVSGSVSDFVALMNQRAKELGMTNTHFVSPYGAFLNQDQENSVPESTLGIYHYTTASDMAKLTVAAAKYKEIMQAGKTDTYTLSATNKQDAREIQNSNPLVHNLKNHPELDQFYYQYATGLKTGTVNNIQLGNTLIHSYGNVVATAQKGDLSLAAMIFDDESQKSLESTDLYSYKRWELAADLFNFGFKNYVWADLASYMEPVSLTKTAGEDAGAKTLVITSQKEDAAKALVDSTVLEGLKNGTVKLDKQVKVEDTLPSTVQMGDTVGTVSYTLNGTQVYSVNLVATSVQVKASATARQTTEQKSGAGGGPGWLLWVLIPVGAVAAVFLIREINIYNHRRSRRRRRRSGILGKILNIRRKL